MKVKGPSAMVGAARAVCGAFHAWEMTDGLFDCPEWDRLWESIQTLKKVFGYDPALPPTYTNKQPTLFDEERHELPV